MIAPRAFVTDEEAHRATADAVMLARSIRFLLNFVVVGYVVNHTFERFYTVVIFIFGKVQPYLNERFQVSRYVL